MRNKETSVRVCPTLLSFQVSDALGDKQTTPSANQRSLPILCSLRPLPDVIHGQQRLFVGNEGGGVAQEVVRVAAFPSKGVGR